MGYIVRADYYPNGKIVPLGITDCQGNSRYFCATKEIGKGLENLYCYECEMGKGEKVLLRLSNNKWTVESIP